MMTENTHMYERLDPRGVELAYQANAAYDLWQRGLRKEAFITDRYKRRLLDLITAQTLAFEIGENETDVAAAEYEDLVQRAGAFIGREAVPQFTPEHVQLALIRFEARVGYGSSDGCYDPTERLGGSRPYSSELQSSGYVDYDNGEVAFVSEDEEPSS